MECKHEQLAAAPLGAAHHNAFKNSLWSGKSLGRAVRRIAGQHLSPRYFGPCRSHEVAQLILGPGEALIPVAFSRDLIQNKAGNSFLLGFGESCYFGKAFSSKAFMSLSSSILIGKRTTIRRRMSLGFAPYSASSTCLGSVPNAFWASAAAMKASRSPSSTAPVLEVLTPVRRSFTI